MMQVFWLLSQLLILCKGVDILRIPEENPQPNSRKNIVMNGIFSHNYFIFFGGFYSQDKVYNDIWNYNMTDHTWNQMFSTDGDDPGIFYLVARYAGAGYWNYITDEYCIWGGMSIRGQLNDLWCFHMTSYMWRKMETSGSLIKPRYRVGYVSWNESSTVMLAIIGGLTIEHASFDMYIMNTTSAVIKKQTYDGELPGAQDSPNLFYNHNYIYLVGGISPYDTNPYAPKFFRYNRTEQKWKNITNNDHIFKFRSNYQGRIYNDILYLFPGLDSTSSSIESSIWAVNLTDPEHNDYEWYEVIIQDDPDGVLLRSSYAVTRFDDQLYMFGGVVGSETRNDFITFNLSSKDPMQFVYHPSWLSPSQREYHSLALVGSSFYVFGGDQIGVKLSDLWKLSIKTFYWELVNPGGEIPPARSHHACASFGDIMVIWGGEGTEGYLNDGYIYNSLTNLWTKIITSSSTIPSPRAGPCLDIMNSDVIIYGGKTIAGLSSEMWLFDLGTSTYTLLDSGNKDGPGALYLTSCRFSSDHPHIYYVMMGVGENDIPSNGFRSFNYSSYKWTKIYTGDQNTLYDRGDTRAFKIRSRFVYAGGVVANTPTNSLIYLNTASGQFTNFGALPEYAYAGAQVQFGNYYVTHGGGSSIGQNLRRTIPNGNAFRVDLFSDCKADQLCDWKCTPGTYTFTNNTCLPCEPGHYQPYFQSTSCVPCPVGTYYDDLAAVSIIQCYPCDEGYYNPSEGARYCLECPYKSYCPPGSFNFTQFFPNFTTKSVQPDLYQGSKTANRNSMIAQLTIGLTGFLILAVLIVIIWKNDWVKIVDVYTAMHNHELEVPMVLRKTKTGGFFSIAFIFVALLVAISTLITFAENNILETKTLVPIIVMQNDVSKFKTDLNITVRAINYGADCLNPKGECQDISFTSVNIEGSWNDIHCSSDIKDCIISLSCSDCQVDPGSYIDFSYLNRTSYSSGFTVNVTTTSSIPNAISSYELSVLPDSGKIFRGSEASTVYLDIIPSYYQNTDTSIDVTGYHLSLTQDAATGSQYHPYELIVSYNLYFKITFNRNSNCLITTRSAKQTFMLLISTLLGSIFGIMGAIGGGMKFTEAQMKNAHKKKEHFIFKNRVNTQGIYINKTFKSIINENEKTEGSNNNDSDQKDTLNY